MSRLFQWPYAHSGSSGGEAGQPQVVAQARRRGRIGEQVQPKGPGRARAGRSPGLGVGRARARARWSRPRRPSRRSSSATAPARSRPAGCRPRRASRAGSRGRCSGGRHRAGRRARAGRRPRRGGRRARSRAARRRAGQLAPRRNGAGSGRSSISTRSRLRESRAGSLPMPARRREHQLGRSPSITEAPPSGRRWPQALVHQHALGELDQPVGSPALLGEQGQLVDQRVSVAAHRAARAARGVTSTVSRPRARLTTPASV